MEGVPSAIRPDRAAYAGIAAPSTTPSRLEVPPSRGPFRESASGTRGYSMACMSSYISLPDLWITCEIYLGE